MPVQFILRRLLSLIPVLFLVSVGVFGMTYLLPGDPALYIAGEDAPPERIAQVREQMGLDDPVLQRYWDWISGVLHGDLGTSLLSQQSVWEDLARRFPVTLSLAIGAMTFTIVVGMIGGILAARRQGTWIDRLVQAGASLGIAMPSFWIALILVVIFAINLGWLPAVGYTPITESPTAWLQSIILPSLALGAAGAAVVARQLRGSLIEAMSMDYVRTAKSRGLSQTRIVAKHSLKNAMMPVLTLLGIQVAYLLGGTVVVEQIFGIPGVGLYVYTAVTHSDFPVIQGAVLVIAVLVVLVNLLVDISYGFVNPKLKQS